MLEIIAFDTPVDELVDGPFNPLESEKSMLRCLEGYLVQIRLLGEKYGQFVAAYFSETCVLPLLSRPGRTWRRASPARASIARR